MSFPERLVALRKARGFSQRALAERVGVHLTQVQRYESGAAEPTLEKIKNLAVSLSVSADALVFDEGERDVRDDALRLIFEAVDQFAPEEKSTAKEVLEGLIIKYQSRRWGVLRSSQKTASESE